MSSFSQVNIPTRADFRDMERRTLNFIVIYYLLLLFCYFIMLLLLFIILIFINLLFIILIFIINTIN